MTKSPMLGIVACAAGGLEELRLVLVEPLIDRGWRVGVTLTPTAAAWLDSLGETVKIAAATGLPVRSTPRLPSDARPHPPVDGYLVAPASANSVAKMALGIADNQAMTQVCEAIGNRIPVIVFPRVNVAHAQHPAWDGHLRTLARAGVHLICGEVWPLEEPRSGTERKLPWKATLDAVEERVRA